MRDSLAEDTCTLGLHSLCSFSKEREADAPPSPFQSHREGQGFLQGAGQSQERRNGSSADQRLCTRAEVPKPHSRELCLLGIHPELRCDHLAVRFNWNPLSLIPDGASPFLGPQSPLTSFPEDFPGGTVDQNLPVNAGDNGSFPGPGRSHMSRSI